MVLTKIVAMLTQGKNTATAHSAVANTKTPNPPIKGNCPRPVRCICSVGAWGNPLIGNVRRHRIHDFAIHANRFAANEMVPNHSVIDIASSHCRSDSSLLVEPLHALNSRGNHSAVASNTIPIDIANWKFVDIDISSSLLQNTISRSGVI